MKHREDSIEKKDYHKKFIKLIFLSIPLFITAWIFLSVNWNQKIPDGHVTVYIPPGKNTTQIGKILEEKDVIKNVTLFRLYSSYLGVSDKLVAGQYELRKNSSLKSVINILNKGPAEKSLWITLPEGITANKIAEKIDNIGKLKKDEFQSLIKQPGNFDYPFTKTDISSLEGYLFPNTYMVFSNTKTEQFIKMLLDEFNSKVIMQNWKYAQDNNLNKHQIITIASLIEREAKISAERPIIAAVIYNRLAKNMPLQIDATVQYALPKWKTALTYNDLKVDSPYNTYRNKGLPPGPICNPGIDSIKAALNPASNDFIYYVLVDASGRHAFAKTYPEFLRLKKLRP